MTSRRSTPARQPAQRRTPALTLAEQRATWDADHRPLGPPPLPPGRVRLDDRHIACASCGREVVAGTNGEFVTDRLTTRWINDRPAAVVRLGTCPSCSSLDVQARRTLDSTGTSTDAMALSRLLIAWRIVGQPLPDPARVTARDVQRWFGHLSLDWAGRILAGTESGQHAAAEPFAHVPPAVRAAIRTQFARWQHTRARPGQPLTITPPSEGLSGCLYCGIGSIDVPAERAHDSLFIESLWQSVDTSAQALGGRGGQRVRGHLCPNCVAACSPFDGPRIIGPSSLERALAAHWDATGHAGEAEALKSGELTGAVGWGALQGREPNTEPWSHIAVPDLTAAVPDA